jgi:NAD(P)-dependent dehydrogenase (short-subunit alcohol dehydrogenase family)
MSRDAASRGAVVVTGASRGIGAAIALAVANAGYPVCVNYRSDESGALRVVQAITDAGGVALAARADVSNEADVIELFKRTSIEFGPMPIYGLVNNAGIDGGRCNFIDLKIEQLESVLAVNVVGPALCAREATNYMARSRGGNGGVIINISSQVARFGSYKLAHYAASKAALEGLTVSIARELAIEDIRVNAVSPGVIESGGNIDLDIERKQALINSMPMGRIGTPDEVASAVLWLLSPTASYVSGVILPVHGAR